MERAVLVTLIFLLLGSHEWLLAAWLALLGCVSVAFCRLTRSAFGVIALYGRYSEVALGVGYHAGRPGTPTSWEIGEAGGSIKGPAATAAEVP